MPKRRGPYVLALMFVGCTSNPDMLRMKITVAKQVHELDGTTCYATCAESEPPRPALGLSSVLCSDPDTVPCGAAGGEDTLFVVADFGDVSFIHPEQLSASLTTLLDGTVLSTSTMRTEVAPAPYAYALVAAPARAGRLRFDADAGSGFASSFDAISVTKPVFNVKTPDCEGASPCTRTALVGTQHLLIDAPVNVDPPNALVDSFVDEVPSMAAVNIPLVDVGGARRAGSFAFDVPASGTFWRLRTHIGDQVLDEQLIKLIAPSIDVLVTECQASPCSVAPDSTVNVQVRAPLNIRTLDAIVSMRIDGIEQDKKTAVRLANCPGSDAPPLPPAECKTLQLGAPPLPAKQFQIFATIGIYQGFSLPIQIAP